VKVKKAAIIAAYERGITRCNMSQATKQYCYCFGVDLRVIQSRNGEIVSGETMLQHANHLRDFASFCLNSPEVFRT